MKIILIALSIGSLQGLNSCDVQKVSATEAKPPTATVSAESPKPSVEEPIHLFGISFDRPEGWYQFPKFDSVTSTPGGQTLLSLVPAKTFAPDLPEFAMITVEVKRVDAAATASGIMGALSAMSNRGGIAATDPQELEINGIKFSGVTSLIPDRPFKGASWKTETLGTIVEVGGRRIFYAFFFNYEVTPDGKPVTEAHHYNAMVKAMKSLRTN